MLGKQNGLAFLEDSLVLSYYTKHTLITQPSNGVSWYLPKEIETYITRKHLHGCLQ